MKLIATRFAAVAVGAEDRVGRVVPARGHGQLGLRPAPARTPAAQAAAAVAGRQRRRRARAHLLHLRQRETFQGGFVLFDFLCSLTETNRMYVVIKCWLARLSTKLNSDKFLYDTISSTFLIVFI